MFYFKFNTLTNTDQHEVAQWLRRAFLIHCALHALVRIPSLPLKIYGRVIKVFKAVVAQEKNYTCFELNTFFFESVTPKNMKGMFFSSFTLLLTEKEELAER